MSRKALDVQIETGIPRDAHEATMQYECGIFAAFQRLRYSNYVVIYYSIMQNQ